MWPLVLLLFAPQYELKGRLEPAVHASISLQSTSTAFSTSVLSNPEGRFRFTKLNSGTYTVIVFAPGMGEMRTSVDVGPSTPEVTIRLSQARDTGAEHKVSAKALSILESMVRVQGCRSQPRAESNCPSHPALGARDSISAAVQSGVESSRHYRI